MKVRKKPVEVEAVRFNGGSLGKEDTPFTQIYETGTAFDEFPDWLEEAMESGRISTRVPYDFKIGIITLEGVMWADAGDYIVKGVKNELYPCKPDVFELTYDVLEEDTENDFDSDFKIGDKITPCNNDWLSCVEEMHEWAGSTMTVSEIDSDGDIRVEENIWYWSPNWVRKIEEPSSSKKN